MNDMFLRRYRRKIANTVKDKMVYMGSCPNEIDIVLSIIAPKDYTIKSTPHCNTNCTYTDCKCCCSNIVQK